MENIRSATKYINLYSETEYSILSSPNKLEQFVLKAKEYGYKALGISDQNNMYGAIKFYLLCKKNDIKPILGINVTLNSQSNIKSNLLIYAINNEGYKSILKIATACKLNADGLTIDYLCKMCNDCKVIIPSDENEIVRLYNEGSYDNSIILLNKYKSCFNNLFLGLDMQTYNSKVKIDSLLNMASKNNIECLAINKTSYLNNEDFDAYKMLKCIGLGINEYPYTEKEMNQAFLNPMQANDLFRKYPKLIENTEKFCEDCNVNIEFGKYKMPNFDENIKEPNNYLKELSIIGLSKRLKNANVNKDKYMERLLYELDVITKMGFCGYFLFVYDFVKYAKKNNILVGPGRGSAPGSLVAYSLGITEIDPIKYDLLFERFLNPERISMPDIDTDFPDDRRDDIIRYVGKKYGKERIAHISTFGTFGVRLAIRDIARVKKMSNLYVEEIFRQIGNSNDTIKEILENSSTLKRMMNENKEVEEMINLVGKLEGIPRNISTHAAGIIMADTDLVNYTPLQYGMNGLFQTQYEASDLEKIGLVKTDFLGIRNLTIIENVLNIINKNININSIPLDDEKTYKMIASGDTDGLFQLESSGMRQTLQQLKTSSFTDIVNAIALYRPGPMAMIPSFIKRKFGLEKVTYIHKDLENILKSTYGAIVFQEQIILIAQKIAGYSLGQADILRRAMSKKDTKMMTAERERFVEAATKNGYTNNISNTVYDYIERFASYGFNKSHSVAYSMIAYQMSYLKCHYYKYFMSVLMSNTIGNTHLIKMYISNCNKQKIKVNAPSINISTEEFIVKDNTIYYSLLGIQNLGALTLKALLEERNLNGIYTSYDEFIKRTKNILNKRVVESLIFAGALDDFNIPRKQMILEYETSIELSNYGGILKEKLNEHFFSDEEYTFEEISKLEKEYLGLNIKYDIFKKYFVIKEKYKTTDINNVQIGKKNILLFVISQIRSIKTKKGDEMAFLEIYDDTDSIDAVMFPEVYNTNKDKLNSGNVYLCEANVENRDAKRQAIIQNIFVVK